MNKNKKTKTKREPSWMKLVRAGVIKKYKRKEGYFCNSLATVSFKGIHSLPDNLTVKGSLFLGSYSSIKKLPKNLKVMRSLEGYEVEIKEGLEVRGDCTLRLRKGTTLPENIKIGGKLDISSSGIKSLPKCFSVGKDLNLACNPITSLKGLSLVKGDLNLRETKITSLPDNLVVEGELKLGWKSKLKTLPKGLNVGELDLGGTKIKTLPDDLKVEYLDLNGSKITTIPKTIEIRMGLSIGPECLVTTLPEGIKLKSLDASYSNLESLPENMTIEYVLNIEDTKIDRLPKGLSVGENIIINYADSEDDYDDENKDKIRKFYPFPSDLKVGGEIIGYYKTIANSVCYIMED